MQLTNKCLRKTLTMFWFEPRISDVGGDHSANFFLCQNFCFLVDKTFSRTALNLMTPLKSSSTQIQEHKIYKILQQKSFGAFERNFFVWLPFDFFQSNASNPFLTLLIIRWMRIRQKMAQRQANVFTLGEPTFRPTHVPGKKRPTTKYFASKKEMVLFTMFQAAWSRSCKQGVKISLHL